MRAVGLDLGERRIGVAVSDSYGAIASPRDIIERCGNVERDWLAIAEVVREIGAELLVVGVPVSLDGRSDRDTATKAAAEARAMGEKLGVRVEVQDERLTTALAIKLRRVAAAPAGGGRVAGDDRRKARRARAERHNRRYDSEAAALILQSWLDSHRGEAE